MEDLEKKTTKEYRVIFQLANGKRKYATHNGEILLWDDEDIKSLRINLIRYEQFAITEDLEHFAFSTEELARNFPRRKILRIKGFRTESSDDPLNSNVII